MTRNEIKVWAKRFTHDLSEGDTRILFERVLSQHLQKLTAIRAGGLSWPSIASILAAEGARRADGRLISSDHLRAAYSRLCSKARHPDHIRKGFLRRDSEANSPRHDRPSSKTTSLSKGRSRARSGEPALLGDRTASHSHSTSSKRTRGNQLRKIMHRAQTLRESADD